MLKLLEQNGYTISDLIQCLQVLEEKKIFGMTEKREELTLEQKITEIMKEIGVPPNLMGYNYITKAIEFSYNNENYLKAITTRLYPDIADYFGKRANTIDGNVRHAIEITLSYADEAVLEYYFGKIYRGKTRILTNSQFIAGIVKFLKNNPTY